ncbi:MAG: hypothetical protein M3036_07440, partial [Bifidobacteriales bacterium]|nr:hypothetical protein [Bifidobacteriales bacterium]
PDADFLSRHCRPPFLAIYMTGYPACCRALIGRAQREFHPTSQNRIHAQPSGTQWGQVPSCTRYFELQSASPKQATFIFNHEATPSIIRACRFGLDHKTAHTSASRMKMVGLFTVS